MAVTYATQMKTNWYAEHVAKLQACTRDKLHEVDGNDIFFGWRHADRLTYPYVMVLPGATGFTISTTDMRQPHRLKQRVEMDAIFVVMDRWEDDDHATALNRTIDIAGDIADEYFVSHTLNSGKWHDLNIDAIVPSDPAIDADDGKFVWTTIYVSAQISLSPT